MNIEWFKNQDNVVYAPVDEFVTNFEKEAGLTRLRDEVENFRKNPNEEGKILRGKRRSSVKLIVPNLIFDEKIEMGDSVWVYLGETYETYCLYWPQE